MGYTDQIKYIQCPTLFDEGNIEFSPDDCHYAWHKSMPESPVYQRARQVFNQSSYMYPAPPLFLGIRDIAFPQETLYALRLLIKEPGSNFMLPGKLSCLEYVIKRSTAYQKWHFPDFEKRFVYLTVRSGPVMSTHDDELHVDGFQGVSQPRHIPEQNYLWTSHSPTLFALQPYFVEHLDPGLHNIHAHFEAVTNKSMLMSGLERGLYIIDPYHVHARPKVLDVTRRSMFRLTFSPVEIRDDTNTVNKYLPRGPYNRGDIRNSLVAYDGPASDMENGLKPVS